MTTRPTNGYEWGAWAREQEIESSSARHLLLLLATFVNEYGICWPSMQLLSELSGLSTRSLRRLEQNLVKAGLLEREQTVQANGKFGVNRYQLVANGTVGHQRPAAIHDRRSKAARPAATHGHAKNHHKKNHQKKKIPKKSARSTGGKSRTRSSSPRRVGTSRPSALGTTKEPPAAIHDRRSPTANGDANKPYNIFDELRRANQDKARVQPTPTPKETPIQRKIRERRQQT